MLKLNCETMKKRTFFRKTMLALQATLWLTVLQAGAQPRISIFFDHVGDIARQEKISVTEAAQRVRQLGIEGIDVRVLMPDSQMRMLDSLGFQHASAIADIDFVKGEQPKAVRQALDFMHRYHYSRLLVIPASCPKMPARNSWTMSASGSRHS